MDNSSKKSFNIPGTSFNGQNAQLLVSTGIQALDNILGGGLPVGTVALIEEDIPGSYARTILDYYLAEGIVSKHSILVASVDTNPLSIVKGLPAVINNTEPDSTQQLSSNNNTNINRNFNNSPIVQKNASTNTTSTDQQQQQALRIAFRYQNQKVASSEDVSKNFIGHNYDLTKIMPLEDIENSDISYWTGQGIDSNIKSTQNSNHHHFTFSNPTYHDLLKSINVQIKRGKFFAKDNPAKRTVLRIGVHSLGSPLWFANKRNEFHLDHFMMVDDEDCNDLTKFIFCLRALVRSAYAVAVITIPSHLYHEDLNLSGRTVQQLFYILSENHEQFAEHLFQKCSTFMQNSLDRCIHSSDIAMRLQAFSGTEFETNSTLSDYHGFFYLTKLAAINSFASKHPGSAEYVFKLRRKKLAIEKLHLPPGIQESDESKRGGAPPSLACGGPDRHLLDF